MLKICKKLIPLLLAAALCFGVLAGCGAQYKRSPLEGGVPEGEVSSNGGFVVEKGDYVYFINGAEDYSADNTFGDVVKGSLMRIKSADLAAGDMSAVQTVVPALVVSQDYTSGFYIYGDRVYYATPNVIGDMSGEVQSSYLDFKSSKLDGSETMSHYYVQVSDNTTVFRYVQGENGIVYLLYVDSAATEIHSYNTETGVDTVLVSGYADYELNADDLTDPTVYYTMSVVKKNTYTQASGGETYSYQQLYRVRADVTESPYDLDLSDGYVDSSLTEGDEGYMLDYVNLGTIVLDGIGADRDEYTVTPFNHDWTADTVINSAQGYTYTLVKYTDGKLLFTLTDLDMSTTSSVFALDTETFRFAKEWNSITANPASFTASADGAILPLSVSSTNVTDAALYFSAPYAGSTAQYYIYVSNGAIVRVRVSQNATEDFVGETVTLAKGQTDASLLYVLDGYLYFSMAGTNGNALYRMRCDGTAADYNVFEGAAYDNDDYKPTKYLEIDYNSSWYKPEIVAGTLFFCNAETNADTYVYAMQNPADNAALAALNEQYKATQDKIAELDTDFADAANLARYYYYTGNLDLPQDENDEYFERYEEEDFVIANAYAECAVPEGYHFDFTSLKEGETAYNVQSAFYRVVGTVAEEDAETIADTLATTYLKADDSTETTEETPWTWQWAAIFVPVGLVVIAGVVVAIVLVRRRRARR